jgi:beta-lactam-binding protein with PASTA domain
MLHTIAHAASAVVFVLLTLPHAAAPGAFDSADRYPAGPEPLTSFAPGTATTAEQRAQSRIVDQVRSQRIQVQPKCVRVIPNLTDRTPSAARSELAQLNLALGRVQNREVSRPRGTIVDQAPKAGTRVACGSPVDIWIEVPVSSRGDDVRPEPTCFVQVPSLTGHQLDDVRPQLARAKLQVGQVNTRESDRVRGAIIGQSPASGTRVKCGSPIDVVVAIPIPPRADDVQPETTCFVPVPDLTGHQLGNVRQLLARAKLDLGKVNTRESDGVRGAVIGQLPASGRRVRCGSPVDVLIAIPVPQRPDDVQPVPPCLVPDLTGSGAAETKRQLARAKLELGTVNSRQADRPPATVLDQSPRPGRAVTCGSQVDVVIAVAPPKPEPAVVDCRVPNVAADDVSEVKRKLAQANLVLGTLQNRPADRQPGTVVDQVPRPGATVRCGSQIDVWIATPCPPVPQLIGRDPKTAAVVLERAGLRIGSVATRESDQAVGVIVEQVPAGGSDVACGTSIALWVAAPPIVVRVPALLGDGATDARRTLEGVGLHLGEIGRRASEEPAATVVDQLPRPGTLVKPGTGVQVWLATVQPRTVPDLRGRDRSGANDALTTARLRLGNTGERPSDDPAGTIVDQSPKAGATVDPGTSVQVWFAVPRSATVPDLRGRDRNGAIASLTSVGLRPGDIGERPSNDPVGTVVDQTPPAGTVARVSTPVQVWLAVPVPIEVPGVVGHSRADATAMLRDQRLRIGTVRSRESAEPAGVVVEQTPRAGQRVGAQTAVDLWIATPRRIQVPDLRGRSQADAIAALTNAGLAIGPTLEREGPEPQGTVAGHQPAAGATVDAGTVVSLWIAVPAQPALVEVPDVGGRSRSDAERIIIERRLAMAGATTTEPSTNPLGTVVRQQPSAGMRVPPGTLVSVVLAAVVTAPVVRVPSVAGLSVAGAHDVLRGAGLQPGAVTHARAWAMAGTVTSQLPAAGSSAQPGATVDLVVASSSAAILWVLAGLGLGVAAAAGVSRVRGRHRLPPSLTLEPYADAGIQISVPDDRALADCEISLQGFRDDGLQALQGPLVIGEIAEAR